MVVVGARPDHHGHTHRIEEFAVALVLRARLRDVVHHAFDARDLPGDLVALGLRVHPEPADLLASVDDPEHADGLADLDRLADDAAGDRTILGGHEVIRDGAAIDRSAGGEVDQIDEVAQRPEPADALLRQPEHPAPGVTDLLRARQHALALTDAIEGVVEHGQVGAMDQHGALIAERDQLRAHHGDRLIFASDPAHDGSGAAQPRAAHRVSGALVVGEQVAEVHPDELIGLEAEEQRRGVVHPSEAPAGIDEPDRIERSVQDREEFRRSRKVGTHHKPNLSQVRLTAPDATRKSLPDNRRSDLHLSHLLDPPAAWTTMYAPPGGRPANEANDVR